ncbi:hypothetical protein PBI_WINKY_140 [Mycobacterium phage Winky]|uniref:Uncharacterized protein n=2 Tax=Faithunavirus TaxID=2948705 RepID=F6M8C0_9CAUD|nr:hypothetical protein SEA_FAITH1_137 [Mycobacterium phage Faith1]YP_009017332.1 hypothetical protein CL57_gp105 [Mycobacterium phage Rumpelstiltskin]AGK87691.1 hypothetical protein PBI_WINKY_140 [Mycobacterium phage Winky]AGM12737.1 hypothetical protein PBI_BREEZONA_140 [Mycobacterium phage Breezona]AOT22983.1 hypothetical protein SEA_ZAKAI_142 [Mycobacterium phage Zakai]ASM62734.1 hypothetical protein SEA_MILEY16_140 [Mycobacterium phage Miley16]AYN57168.1 hypothetical protein PBI_BIGCHEES
MNANLRAYIAHTAKAHGWTVVKPKPDPIDKRRGVTSVLYMRGNMRIQVGWRGPYDIDTAVRDFCGPTERFAYGTAQDKALAVQGWLVR